MCDTKQYRCVNCRKGHSALYKTYGPSVLKLTKCDKCKGIVDKYIEYDPVIVMIDLVLMSKEAQRHVLYNTGFESYWKLFIILMMLETYGVWHSDSLFNLLVDTICDFSNRMDNQSNYTTKVAEYWKVKCWEYKQENRGDNNDLFIWEKDFYIQFLATFSGILVFLLILHCIMSTVKSKFMNKEVSLPRVVQAFSLANMSAVFSLPTLVWGADAARPLHYILVFVYSFKVFTNVFTVLYECPTPVTIVTLLLCNCAKYVTSFHAILLFRGQIL
ncbi:protein ARV1 isoform X2 [Galleria mellonella]|uniref:Protein ARV n=1 Tax=Galleria mellonella TaxID=7137 RepID=A0ABM3MSF9_GALME|nr:protein ARV1 isoform X2 [Galleria mellonella]